MNQALNKRIMSLTSEDIRTYGKSKLQLFASTIEELGELASALKIHTGLVKHKTLPEPITGESADLYICAIMMRSNPEEINYKLIPEFTDSFEALIAATSTVGTIAASLGLFGNTARIDEHCEELAQIALNIFFLNNPEKSDFVTIANAKLDKWEKNQKKFIDQTK